LKKYFQSCLYFSTSAIAGENFLPSEIQSDRLLGDGGTNKNTSNGYSLMLVLAMVSWIQPFSFIHSVSTILTPALRRGGSANMSTRITFDMIMATYSLKLAL
jgi:hypothetical protein